MSDSILNNPPLISHFETQTFGQMALAPVSLSVQLSYQPTELKKTGLQALLAKTPLGGGDTLAMDIDVGCALYNNKDELIELVWYGNVRNKSQAIRLSGDSFGDMIYRQSLLKEHIDVHLPDVANEVHKMVFFVNSYHKQPLRHAVFGQLSLVADGDELHKIQFASLEPDTTALACWQMTRISNDWQVSALLEAVKSDLLSSIAKNFTGLSKQSLDD